MKLQHEITKQELQESMSQFLSLNEIKVLMWNLENTQKYKKIGDILVDSFQSKSLLVIEILDFIARRDSFDTLILMLQKLHPEISNAIWNQVEFIDSFEKFEELFPTRAEKFNRFFAGFNHS